MKREGRQHGLVRSYEIQSFLPIGERPETRFISQFDSPPTAGNLTRVPGKPCNHSKFSGKCKKPRCNGCHLHPVSKARDKTKGAQKLKSRDVVSNYRLVTWRVTDVRPGLNFAGLSATGILDHLQSDSFYDQGDGEEWYDDDVPDDHRSGDGGSGAEPEVELESPEEQIVGGAVEIGEDSNGEENCSCEDDEFEMMSFYDLGMVFDRVLEVDEGWCLVEEM